MPLEQTLSLRTMPRLIKTAFEYFALYTSFALLGLICLGWSVFALPLYYLLPREFATKVGRRGIMYGFRIYAWSLSITCSYRLDLSALDALLILTRHPVPVQTLIIDTDSPFLGKGWPLFRRPDLPIVYKVRLGKRFEPPRDPVAFTATLEEYYRRELEGSLQSRWLKRD
jgi:hypothetical protein